MNQGRNDDEERNTDRKRDNDESIVDGHQTPPHSFVSFEDVSKPSVSGLASNLKTHFSPSDLRPFPKAAKRMNNRKSSKKRKSTILTDTPNKNEIEEDQQRRNAKKMKQLLKSKGTKRNLDTGTKKSKQESRRREKQSTKTRTNQVVMTHIA
jgi:hypothetical protein